MSRIKAGLLLIVLIIGVVITLSIVKEQKENKAYLSNIPIIEEKFHTLELLKTTAKYEEESNGSIHLLDSVFRRVKLEIGEHKDIMLKESGHSKLINSFRNKQYVYSELEFPEKIEILIDSLCKMYAKQENTSFDYYRSNDSYNLIKSIKDVLSIKKEEIINSPITIQDYVLVILPGVVTFFSMVITFFASFRKKP